MHLCTIGLNQHNKDNDMISIQKFNINFSTHNHTYLSTQKDIFLIKITQHHIMSDCNLNSK